MSDIEVDGSNATANVTFEGCLCFADQTLTVVLVEEDGGWKLDENIRFAKLDQHKVVNKLAEGWGARQRRIASAKPLASGRVLSSKEFLIDGFERPFDEIFISCVGKR